MSANRAGDGNERFRRLTQREVQVLLLLLEGPASTQDIVDVIGSSRAAVSSIRQSIRRKLGVPRHADLRDFVETVPGLREYAREGVRDEASRPDVERRRHLVLRASLRDLQTLSNRLTARAESLRALSESVHFDDIDAFDQNGIESDAVAELAAAAERLFRSGVEVARTNERLSHQLTGETDDVTVGQPV